MVSLGFHSSTLPAPAPRRRSARKKGATDLLGKRELGGKSNRAMARCHGKRLAGPPVRSSLSAAASRPAETAVLSVVTWCDSLCRGIQEYAATRRIVRAVSRIASIFSCDWPGLPRSTRQVRRGDSISLRPVSRILLKQGCLLAWRLRRLPACRISLFRLILSARLRPGPGSAGPW